MPAVLVHGVPDTHHVWDRVRARLGRDDVVAVSLPGFATPRPDGFPATKEAYVEHLVGELEQVHSADGPVDLVGHDWGSILVQRVACLRPDLLRTWAAGNGPVDEDYTWHEAAQAWQTPGLGEQVMELMTGEALVPTFLDAGHDEAEARAAAGRVDDTMRGCILDLYRSAVDVGAEWGPDLDRLADADLPGLAIWAVDDPYVPVVHGQRLAERTGAALVEVTGGHWWPVAAADTVAGALTSHWATA